MEDGESAAAGEPLAKRLKSEPSATTPAASVEPPATSSSSSAASAVPLAASAAKPGPLAKSSAAAAAGGAAKPAKRKAGGADGAAKPTWATGLLDAPILTDEAQSMPATSKKARQKRLPAPAKGKEGAILSLMSKGGKN